ncbi:unnamed protein product [Porites lobata]|uniref:Uncharacterized protein n=1 Tax=Porites lobata TaxID=104759 RepID=A0ABN8RPC9_9CNID|nr:unnamed protein product [Porites lobata]
MHWSCCLEEHPKSGGSHFHMALKLDRNQRWLPSKRFLYELCGISVHFSAIHRNYFSAWKYVTKQDKEFVQSPGHLDLSDGPPKTTRASFANKPHSTGSHGAEPKKTKTNRKKRMSSYDLAEIVEAKKIKSYTELVAFAREQKLGRQNRRTRICFESRVESRCGSFANCMGHGEFPRNSTKAKKVPVTVAL